MISLFMALAKVHGIMERWSRGELTNQEALQYIRCYLEGQR